MSKIEIIILGIAQDAGFPQLGCYLPCCLPHKFKPESKRYAASLGIIDHSNGKRYLIDATPDIKEQMLHFDEHHPPKGEYLSGIFLTHAHVGHYTGLMHFGKEGYNAKNLPTYVMPRMEQFLKANAPWIEIAQNNLNLNILENEVAIILSDALNITPFLVPHRDEHSETVGFKITGLKKSLLFIPDIDAWNLWDKSLLHEIQKVDYALLDGTFLNMNELPGRDISKIPHPTIEQTTALLKDLPANEKEKVHFIHLNHSNPLILSNEKYKGFGIAKQLGAIQL